MSTLLVSGGGGFVMSHVGRQWLEKSPSNRLVILDSTPLDELGKVWFSGHEDRVTVVTGSVADPAIWASLPVGITNAVHGAAVTSINRLSDEGAGLVGIVPALDANIIGTANALAWAQGCPDLASFIYVSSGSVYADEGPDPLPEDGYVEPEGYYAISKRAGEMLTEQTRRQFGLKAASVRLSGVYGPMDRETPHRAVECVPMRIARAALSGEVLKVRHPDAVGDFIHAGCVARAILALLAVEAPAHPVYNVAYGERLAYRALLAGFAGLVPGFAWVETEDRNAGLIGDPTKTTARWGAYDTSRIRAETTWEAWPIERALDDYLRWLRAVAGAK